jgi:hypothetical protein
MLQHVAREEPAMTIRSVVQEARDRGRLTHSAQGQLARLIELSEGLPEEDYRALVELRAAIEAGWVRVETRRAYRNIMEELAVEEIEARWADEGGGGVDRGDVLACALNRLPPLYATTDVGAQYQRERARHELRSLVAEQVTVALHRARERPEPLPERRPLGADASEPLLRHIASLLHRFASDYELPG